MPKVGLPNHTQIPNFFIENMAQYSGAEVKVFIAICRKTIGWHKVSDRISYSQLKDLTGLSTNGLKKAIAVLVQDDFIIQEKTKYGYRYDILFEHIEKLVSLSDTAVSKSDTSAISINDTTKETITKKTNLKENNIPFSKIIDYLNEKTDSHYKHTTNGTQKHIRARWAEGFKLIDFMTVIQNKVDSWGGTEWEKYLRPSTLFGPKFESYLNEKNKPKPQNNYISIPDKDLQ